MRIGIKKFKKAFILTSILLGVSIISAIYFTLSNNFELKEGNRLNVILRNSAKDIDNFMFTRVADFNVLSNNPLFSSSSNEITSQYLERVVEQYPFYNNLFFVNKKGIILSSSDEKLIGEDLLQLEPGLQDELTKTINGGNEDVFISDLSLTSKNEINSNQLLELKILSDVIDLEGNVVGVLVGFMNMKLLKELIFFTDNNTVDNKHVYLLNNKGVVLFSGNKEVKIFQQHPDVSINKLQEQLKVGENGFYFNENSKGVKVLFEYAMLSKHGSGGVGNWFLISIVPYNEIMKPFYETVYKTVFIFLLSISLLIIFVFYSNSKRVKNALLLAENRENSLKEASKLAKIGFFEDDIATGTRIWSEYLYHIFGLDLEKPIPPRTELLALLDEESQQKMIKVTQDLDLKGISYDIELRLINFKNEEVWIRDVTQPIYNQQKEVIGRKGVTLDITESKNAQLQIEFSNREIQNSFHLLEKRDFSMNEASKIAKIGYLEDDFVSETRTWSDNMYHIFGLDPKDKVLSGEETLALMDEESKQKAIEGGLKLDSEGIPIDIEIKLTNLREEEIWLRLVVHPVYNNQKDIVGRRGVVQDITDSKKAQFELEHSKQNLETILEAVQENEYSLKEAGRMAKIGYWKYDTINDTIIWSEAIHQIYGNDIEKGVPGIEIILGSFTDKSRKKLIEATVTLASDGVPFDIELEMINFKNEKRWIRNMGEPIYNDKNEIIGRRGVSQDITMQKRITDKIKKAEELYRVLTDNSNDLICLQEPDSTFKYISPSIKNLLGYEQSQLIGKKVFNLVHSDDIQLLYRAIRQKEFRGLNPEAISIRVRHKEGHFVWLEFLTSPVYKEKEISYFVTSARDITQWVKAREEIQEYQVVLQKMTTEMTLIEEKQKKEIAANIHDHLSQSLVISNMRINELKKKAELKFIDEDLNFIKKNITEALENSRKITYELSPPVLYQLGIIDALNWLFEETEATHKIECRINSNIESIEMIDIKAILLYRSIQELIKNAVKYAKATLFTLDLNKNELGFHILFTDNGVGFNTSKLNNYKNHSGSGFGLFAVQERIRNIQGEFLITSKINAGTSIEILIP